jgi:hypothetical protein
MIQFIEPLSLTYLTTERVSTSLIETMFDSSKYCCKLFFLLNLIAEKGKRGSVSKAVVPEGL